MCLRDRLGDNSHWWVAKPIFLVGLIVFWRPNPRLNCVVDDLGCSTQNQHNSVLDRLLYKSEQLDHWVQVDGLSLHLVIDLLVHHGKHCTQPIRQCESDFNLLLLIFSFLLLMLEHLDIDDLHNEGLYLKLRNVLCLNDGLHCTLRQGGRLTLFNLAHAT